MNKYRIRLKSGRVIGPFVKRQIQELYEKEHIFGTEECQIFPAGDWCSINDFPELVFDNLIKPLQPASENLEDTLIRKISVIDKHKGAPQDFPEEFKVNVGEIDKRKKEQDEYQKKLEATNKEKFKVSNLKVEIEKTIVNLNTQKYLEDLKKQKELEDQKKTKELIEKQKAEELRALEEVNPSDATQVVKLDEIKNLLKREVQSSEQQMVEVEMIAKGRPVLPSLPIDDPQQEFKEKKGRSKKKAGTSIVVIIAFLAIFWVLLDDEKKEASIVPKAPHMIFPQEYEIKDKKQSLIYFKQGLELYKKGTYLAKLSAAAMFEKSLSCDFLDNNALGMLILTYSEMLQDSANKQKDGNTIFRLIRAAEVKSLKDINIAMGRAVFFLSFDKGPAAFNVLEDFLRLNKPSLRFMSIYLRTLIKIGNLAEARRVIDKVVAVKNKPVELYVSLADFYLSNDDYDQAMNILRDGLQQFPNSVLLMLAKVRIHVHREEFQQVGSLLSKVHKLGAESSVYYFAKYLEYTGILSAYQNKIDETVKLFRLSLKIQESPELRSKLASLDVVDGKATSVSKLITESKSIDLMNSSKFAIGQENWELAMSKAVEAVDLAPNYSKAIIFLADLQIKRGYFDNAINSLLKLYSKDSQNIDVNLALVRAYVAAYKFKDAQKHLNLISSSSQSFRESAQYAMGLAEMYIQQKLYLRALKWLKESIVRNPIDDNAYYRYAMVLIELNKYKDAQNLLSKAIALDPSNIDYKIAYSKILYEQGTDISIGYLRGILKENPDQAKILGEIAINYYKSGQIKYFEDAMKKLSELPKRSSEVYEYLIRASMLEEKFEEVVKYSEECLKLDPGKLNIRMQLGEVLLGMKKYKEALKNFNLVKERLPSYPKMLFFVSKIWLAEGNTKKALEMAEEEIKMNPDIEDGYVLVGNIKSNLGEYSEALLNYQKAQQINPNSVDALTGLASIKFRQSHSESALDLYMKAAELEPSNAFLHKQIGMVYKTLGQGALAIESLKTYLDLKPDANDRKAIEQIIEDLR